MKSTSRLIDRWVELSASHGILHLGTSEYLFDLEDLHLIESRNWYPDKDGYLVCGYYYFGRYQVSRFHRIVMHAKAGEIVDHINKNRKDNRKRNLRRCAFTENDRNRGLYSTNTSGVTGVFFDKECGMWLANISYNGRRVYIGRYKHKEDAIMARLKKEVELFGEYAPQRALYETYQGRRSV